MQESGEMYLETILILSEQMERVRSIDVCEHMNFSKPSVSRAVKLLKEGGFILVSPEGYLSLTESGREIAVKIYERHTFLTGLLINIGVDEKVASDDACKIEHDISDATFAAIKRYVNKSI